MIEASAACNDAQDEARPLTTDGHSGFDPLLPAEMARRAETVGEAKANLGVLNLFLLSMLAGAFISLGADFFIAVTTSTGLGYGVTRLIGGIAFSLGLYLVVVAGAELFTGNNLIVMAWAGGRVSTLKLARNWGIVYVGNLIGALGTVLLVYVSGQWRFNGYEVGANALNVANHKVNLGFEEAVALGILCNGLVCLAVWLCYSARSNTDKAISVLFPITAFVASGFEHSVANMFFVPLGLLLKDKSAVVETSGLAPEALENLTVLDFVANNLLPVTLGNLIGGVVLVGSMYWLVYLRPSKG
jgi:formate/nitrite transporter